MKLLFTFLALSSVVFIGCNSNTPKAANENFNVSADTAVSKPLSYEFAYNGITILNKGNSTEQPIKGKILLFENEIQLFNGNKGEKFFIKEYKRQENKITISTENNRAEKSTFYFSTNNGKSFVEADMNHSVAKFHLTSGEFSSIPFYTNPINNSKSAVSKTSADSLYEWDKEYKSVKYGYAIRVSESFHKEPAIRPHIDLKFVDAFGSSISVNVSPRRAEEYNFTAHDYTKEMLEEAFRQATPNVSITYSEKLVVSNEKAFLIEHENSHPDLKSMECYLYHKDFAFVITGTCEESRFSNYRTLFRNCITSLKL